MLLSLTMFLKSFHEYFGTSPGTERPSVVKLLVEESVEIPCVYCFIGARNMIKKKKTQT